MSRWQTRFGRPEVDEEADSWVHSWQRQTLVEDARSRALDDNQLEAIPWGEAPPPDVSMEVRAEAHDRIKSWLRVEEAALGRAFGDSHVAPRSLPLTNVKPTATRVRNPPKPLSKAQPKKPTTLTQATPPPSRPGPLPKAKADPQRLARQDAAVSRRLALEIARVSALQEALATRAAARTLLHHAWGAWTDSVQCSRLRASQARRLHARALGGETLRAWHRVASSQARQRHTAQMEAVREAMAALDRLAAQHNRVRVLLRFMAQWRANTVVAKRDRREGSEVHRRRQLAIALLSTALVPPRQTSQSTSPALPTQERTLHPLRSWTPVKAPSPLSAHSCKATSPTPPVVKLPRRKVVRVFAPPPAIVDMHARMAERQARWAQLQDKYKQKQAAAAALEEEARVAEAAAEAAARAAAAEKKRALEREARRCAEAKRQAQQLRRQQLQLATHHAARATVFWRGFHPWRQRHLRLKRQTIKADNWRHDALMQAALRWWRQFVANAKESRAQQLEEALDDARWYYRYRQSRACLALWKAALGRTRLLEVSLAQQHAWRLCADVWRLMHRCVADRTECLRRAANHMQHRWLGRLWASWRFAVREWQAEAAAAAEKQALRAQVHRWLQEAG
ncbi:hypothetical protein ACHHYP_16545 [Achlya hypogyna]|uniref:Sfi1 spindle body domain-containing protein n=1 Tax=Achlya hypogyna TaxID=1202772 RepID=A0A1V9ZE32_ACHHY|nr:hypothetical protein ACHHYP_16545 [Achlya hypogyna]